VAYPVPFSAHSDRERSIVYRARAAAEIAAAHAARHDREATFPVEGLAELERNGYLSLASRDGACVTELVLGNLDLAKGDASLALVVAMHNALIGRVRDAAVWPEAQLERIASGGLINSLASEPEMGSPSRGGLPSTTARRVADGFILNGAKSFSSGSTVLRWGVVSARVEGVGDPYLGSFLMPLNTTGISIEPTWDTLGMRATCSHTLHFQDVFVGAGAEVPRVTSMKDTLPHERAWSLSVAAVYLGVAEAARDFAINFARERKPTALGGKPIASVPSIRERAARMDLRLFEGRGLLVATAREWDRAPSPEMEAALAAAKVTATNTAVTVAEEAMRLVGGSSMDRTLALERHYRDVRGGLHHPPQDDAALALFARDALD
jgi:alkylation response protein AidB-like acyl-CoA dehydrogenase